MRKIAIVLFNLGGPDRPEAVEPFLFNLFNDPAIIGAPWPIRGLLARFISRRRGPTAREIYAELGGGSPLLANTRAQAAALETALADLGDAKVFIAMRYWHPLSAEAASEVAAFAPDEVVLLPLYPQYSTTTTGSSLKAWREAAAAAGIRAPSRAICCYPEESGFVAAMAEAIAPELDAAMNAGKPRLLFSAHGLPKKVIRSGDPYQWQVERSAAAVVNALGARAEGLDWRVCYQSRVGPLEWIGPATDEEIRLAGAEKRPLVLAPIAFVSEHSETLVELDIEYAKLAREAGVPDYRRVATAMTADPFIGGLARLVREALASGANLAAAGGGRICPPSCRRCAQA